MIVDQSKLVDRLGQKGAVPVEVSPFGWPVVARALENLRGKPSLRLNPDGSEFLTDGGNYILDCSFGPIDNAETLSREIDSIPGVLEHGLFLKMASKVFVGAANGVVQYPK